MTVGELRKLISSLPDAMVVVLEICNEGEDPYPIVDLESAQVETRCHEAGCLYLYGDTGSEQDADDETGGAK